MESIAPNAPRYFLAALFLLLVVYAPTLTSVFDYHDAFSFTVAGCGFHFFPFLHVLLIGRPLNVLLYCGTVAPVMNGRIDLGFLVRLEAIVAIAIAVTMLASYLRRCGIGAAPAAFAALFCFLLPGPQQFVYGTHAVPTTWAFPLTIGAALCTLKMRAAWEDRARRRFMSLAITATVLLTLSSLIYQSATECFLALVFVSLLAPSLTLRKTAIYLVWGGVIGAAHLALYFAIHFGIVAPLASQYLTAPRASRFALGVAQLPELGALLTQRFDRAFALWFFGLEPWASGAVGMLLAAMFGSRPPAGERGGRVRFLGLFILFAVLTNAVAILQSGNPVQPFYLFRTVIALQWVIMFAGAYLLSGYQHSARTPLAGAAVAIAAFVMLNLQVNLVWPNALEFEYLRHRLAEERGNLIGKFLCVIPAVPGYVGSFRDYPVFDEFGRTTTMWWYDLHPMVTVAARAADAKPGGVFIVGHTRPPEGQACTVTIDMRWIANLAFDRRP